MLAHETQRGMNAFSCSKNKSIPLSRSNYHLITAAWNAAAKAILQKKNKLAQTYRNLVCRNYNDEVSFLRNE